MLLSARGRVCMKKARILLSGKENIKYYVEAMEALGAEAVAEYLPAIDASGYDGLLLCGGSDVDPKYYNEEIDGSGAINYERDECEMALLRAFIEAGKPVFGICRGHQLINIYFGGSLIQDIDESALHKSHDGIDESHTVLADKDSIVGKIYGEKFRVNSAHHQVIKVLGKDLRATATWGEKYVEAIEHTTLSIFGVQWHPERMCFGKARPDTVDGSKIIEHFINLCAEGR